MAVEEAIAWARGHCLAAIIFVLGVLIGVGGVTFLISGAVFLAKFGPYEIIFEESEESGSVSFKSSGIEAICCGLTMCVASLLGASMLSEKRFFLKIFFLLLLWLIFLWTFAITLAWVFKDMSLSGWIMKSLNQDFEKDYKISVFSTTTTFNFNITFEERDQEDVTHKPPESEVFEFLQTNLLCCGIKGPSDFSSFTELPESCCQELDKNDKCSFDAAYKNGCRKKLMDSLRATSLVLGAISLFYVLITFFAAILTSVKICTCHCGSKCCSQNEN